MRTITEKEVLRKELDERLSILLSNPCRKYEYLSVLESAFYDNLISNEKYKFLFLAVYN